MVSIIIPIYNASTYLDTCLNSIANQSYKDFEVILVDDGSVDSSSHICKKYVESDCRFKYFYKNNGGVSSARNFGLSQIHGNWLTFIDADDLVTKDFVKNLVEASNENEDIVIDSHQLLYENGGIENISCESFSVSYPSLSSVFLVGNLHTRTSPWGKFYKTSIVSDNNLRFNEFIHHGEDAIFLFNYLLFCKSVKFVDNQSYIYRFDRNGSLTKKINTTESELCALAQIKDLCNKLEEWAAISFLKDGCNTQLNSLQGFYIRRVLSSLYVYTELNFSQRIKCIRTLHLEPYLKYYPIDSTKEQIYKFLLKRKLFIVYDFVRKCIKYLKS